MIQRSPQAMPGALPSPELLRSVLREHARNCARLSRLSAYYDGAHDVTRRERRKGLPNTRIPHGYPAYISDMAAGYLIGSPIRYEYDPSDEIESLCQALRACDSPSVDAELAMQQSVFGRAVELCYADPLTGQSRAMQAYCGERSVGLARQSGGETVWTGVEIIFMEA